MCRVSALIENFSTGRVVRAQAFPHSNMVKTLEKIFDSPFYIRCGQPSPLIAGPVETGYFKALQPS